MPRRKPIGLLMLCTFFGQVAAAPAGGPSLSVTSIELLSGTTGNVIVTGLIEGDSTFGVTVLLELVPRPGQSGTVTFTPAPPGDITQLGEPWPVTGFTPFDTDATGSSLFNGCVLDNNTFLSEPTTFDGPLAMFPVMASEDAAGVWDVFLYKSAGDSEWEGLPTTLHDGTVTVIPGTPVPAASGWWLAAMILTTLVASAIVFRGKAATRVTPQTAYRRGQRSRASSASNRTTD